MKRVKLIKGKDYRGHGIKAFTGKPLSVEDAKADELVATGFFEVEATVAENTSAEDKQEEEQVPIEKMKKEQLVEYAEKNGIDISGCANNDERATTIKAAIAGKEADDGAKAGFEE